MSTLPELTYPPDHGDERAVLTGMLDLQRRVLVRKASGLDRDQCATTVGASSLTLAGLVKHLSLVEEST